MIARVRPQLARQNASISDAGAHLMCDQASPAKGQPKHAKIVGTFHTTGVLGRDRRDTSAEAELCVPSLLL